MDGELRTRTAPFRDARYAPRRLEVEHRAGGEMVLRNPTPYATKFQTMTAALAGRVSRVARSVKPMPSPPTRTDGVSAALAWRQASVARSTSAWVGTATSGA